MPKFTITPAHSPDVLCEFEIPRENAKPIEFAVHRMDYIQNLDEKMIEWATERMAPKPVLDENGDPTLDENGHPRTETPDAISDREAILAQLRIAGVNARTLAQLDKLTNGELSEIFQHWTKQSRVTVGESGASAKS